jgi:hypothetical protein
MTLTARKKRRKSMCTFMCMPSSPVWFVAADCAKAGATMPASITFARIKFFKIHLLLPGPLKARPEDFVQMDSSHAGIPPLGKQPTV